MTTHQLILYIYPDSFTLHECKQHLASEANGLKLSGHAEEPINSHANNNRNNWHPTDADSSNERQTSKRLLSPTASSGRLKNGCNNNNASRFISNENKRDKMCISSTSTINRMQQHLTALSSLNVLNDSQEDVSHLDGSTNSNVRALRESGDALQLNSTDYGNERGQNNNNADKPSLGSPKLLPQEQQSQHQGFVKRSEDEQHSFLSRASDREALDSVPHPRPLIRRDESWQSLMSLTRINRPKPKLFSYSGSPIMHQRSLYAQHIMDDNQYGETRRNSSSVSTPIKSRVPLRPEIFEHNQFVLKYLRQTPVSNTPPQHQTQKTNNASLRRLSSSNSSSTNEYSTNEFCFIRPDSTLPNLSSRSMQFPAQNSSSLLPGNVSDMNSHRTNLSPSYYLNPIQTDQQHQSTSGVLSASDTEAPGRELPLKPNRKRRPKKKSQQGSVMSFLRRAFHRRPSSPQNAAEILTESGFAFDESKLFYPTIVTNTLQGSISTNRSPAGPRMVDIVAAFANQTLIDDAQEDAGYGTEKACSIQLSKNDSQSTIRDSKAAFISNHAADGFQGSAMRTDPSTNSSVTIPQFSPQPQPRSALFGQLTPSARRRQTFMSNGRHLEPRPSSIYGLPSMVSPVSSGLSERNGLNNIHHRNSTQYSRDGSLVMMLPSLDTTREVAEEIASPTSEQANYVQDGNDAMQTLYDNMPPNESARSRYISNQLIMDNDDVEKNVVIPFHRPPAHAVYDNFSNEKSLHSFYDNHSPGSPSLYKSNKVSDSVPSHLSKATLQEMGAQRTSFIGSTSQSPTAGMPYQKPAAIVAPTASTNMNHPATPRYLQPQRTIVHINQVPQRGCSPALSRRTTGSQHMISRSHTSHHVMSISHNQTESAIDVGGVKLEPKLAASLLGNSIDVDNFNSFQRHSCKFSNRSANTTSIEAQPRAFLVSTRLTKSICNNNSQLSTPSRYIQQTEKTQPLSSGIFSKEDIR
ncbi:hypothetical protein GZH46_01999 [Fragariocoptes setiger]|uniref:Uncharacterized protein n=1 Tax=Fragariocoptes setiger TaxID=1670756 RepID=A0ABQ7S7S9_9ACAR|nr:hypothetical protein GZH46_01999 [Fragariocoptes setiger]